MALNLLDEAARITVVDSELADVYGGDPDTTYTVRQIAPEKHKELREKHATMVLNKKTHQREEKVDTDALVEDLFDYALVDWTGILHRGQPVPCERQYKLLLDFQRKAALVAIAGMNRVEEVRAESFRYPPQVL